MGKTTNILDLNNRLERVEKENIAQNNYNSLKNRPKINGNLLTGDKTGTQLGLANAQDVGNPSDLNTTDKSSCVGAINEVNSAKAKKYTYYTSATGVNSIDLTQISFDELKIVVIAPLMGYSCVFELHVFKTDLSSAYLYYSTGNNKSMIKVGITQSLCILNTSICEDADVINDTVIKVYYR